MSRTISTTDRKKRKVKTRFKLLVSLLGVTQLPGTVNESYHECGFLGQLDRQMTDWLVLGSLGMTDTNDCHLGMTGTNVCSHEMTESLMADLDMF